MMDEERREVAESIRDSVRTLRATEVGERLGSRAFRQEHAAEALLRHPDPIMQEIGRQLRDGSMRPADVLSIPEYREAFGRAAAEARRTIDPRAVAAELRELAERQTAKDRR